MPVQIVKLGKTVRGVDRYCSPDNYAESFGQQWNAFGDTQVRGRGFDHSETRFFVETGWKAEDLDGVDLLEVGSGAGRFSRVILTKTNANLYSVDFSEAVEANQQNNGEIAPDRFHLAQASIYELPYAPASFDKVLCLGVLQHTPDFEESVKSLVAMAKPGGEIVVDFYPIRGWWSKINAKYLLRPITKRLSHGTLVKLIKSNIGWMMGAYRLLGRMRLSALQRFLPICDIDAVTPSGLPPEQMREWAVLDTLDMLSPAHDHPQRIGNVVKMFERAGANVHFADFVRFPDGGTAAVVRARRPAGSN